MNRFDLGRYVSIPYIPLFGIEDDVKGEVYPMLGVLGGGHGSVSIEFKVEHSIRSTLKVYPRVVHYLKVRNIGKELPTTNRGMKTRLGQVEALLEDLHASDAATLCGFRFELEFHTTNSLRECYNVARDFCYNSQGVPQGVCIKKYITPEEYIAHLMDVVGDAKNNYLTSGTNAGAPSILQKEEMAKILNAAGYSLTKWIGLVRKKKSVAKIQKDIDEVEKDDEIGEIMKRMYVRRAARNKELMCCMNQEGHCTKAFSTRIELARYVYGRYGLAWQRNIRVINSDEELVPLRKTARGNVAPDLDGRYDVIGVLYVGLQRYIVHDAPRDGSCFFFFTTALVPCCNQH